MCGPVGLSISGRSLNLLGSDRRDAPPPAALRTRIPDRACRCLPTRQPVTRLRHRRSRSRQTVRRHRRRHLRHPSDGWTAVERRARCGDTEGASGPPPCSSSRVIRLSQTQRALTEPAVSSGSRVAWHIFQFVTHRPHEDKFCAHEIESAELLPAVDELLRAHEEIRPRVAQPTAFMTLPEPLPVLGSHPRTPA